MRTSKFKSTQHQALQPVMTVPENKIDRRKVPRMIRIYVEDFNNHPLSYASVKLTSGAFSTNLKYDDKTKSYVSKKFVSDRYDLEVTAEYFEPHFNNFFVPKAGIDKVVCLAKS